MAVLDFDVTDHEAIENVAKAFHRPIDILINNAGVIGPDRQSTLDMDFRWFLPIHFANQCDGPAEDCASFFCHF